nr:hypothetical protein TetV2_00573 [Oceanusvirus sp.]
MERDYWRDVTNERAIAMTRRNMDEAREEYENALSVAGRMLSEGQTPTPEHVWAVVRAAERMEELRAEGDRRVYRSPVEVPRRPPRSRIRYPPISRPFVGFRRNGTIR